MRYRNSTICSVLLLAMAAPAAAQLALPPLPAVSSAGQALRDTLDPAGDLLRMPSAQAASVLRQARLDRIETLLRRSRATIERDRDGEPARRGVLLALDGDAQDLARLRSLGFGVRVQDRLDELGMAVTELTVPSGMDLAAAQQVVGREVPGLVVSSDPLHFASGSAGTATFAGAPAVRGVITETVGLIDGGPAQRVGAVKGFAAGAPMPSNQGSAVASLAARGGAERVAVADVYGSDPAGGNALAIARGMNWLIGQGARVVSISLVGPRNPVVERAVAAARLRKVVVVAAVGNDGPAAPPSFPASYDGVIAVTAVDRRNRPLIEAGRAVHLDYAAPGADMTALNAAGRQVRVRGTSYATPLVAARVAAALGRGVPFERIATELDAEARPLARKIPDPRSGRGLLCETCR